MKNTFIWILKIFIALIALLLLKQGFMWSFLPEMRLESNNIVTNSNLGLNMIKSDMGGGLFSVAIFLLLYVIKGKKWFLPATIMVGFFLVIRTISFIMDGYHQMIVIVIVVEVLILVALFVLNKLQSKKTSEQSI
jgi:hypothetical protein